MWVTVQGPPWLHCRGVRRASNTWCLPLTWCSGWVRSKKIFYSRVHPACFSTCVCSCSCANVCEVRVGTCAFVWAQVTIVNEITRYRRPRCRIVRVLTVCVCYLSPDCLSSRMNELWLWLPLNTKCPNVCGDRAGWRIIPSGQVTQFHRAD